MRRLIRTFLSHVPGVSGKTAGAKRKRRQVRGKGRHYLGGILAIVCLAGLGGLGFAWASGWAGAKGDALLAWGMERSVAAGLVVREIEIVGLTETSRESALQVLAIQPGAPIFAFDPRSAKAALETLPWVRRAAVERHLPDRIRLSLIERRPLALWQRAGKLSLIDAEGIVILREHLARFRHLPIVIGKMAPSKANALFATLQSEPALVTTVATATLIGKRRWNLRLQNGIEIYLPEDGIATAWASLAEYDRLEGITKRKIAAVDLRLKGRLVVRLMPKQAGRRNERET